MSSRAGRSRSATSSWTSDATTVEGFAGLTPRRPAARDERSTAGRCAYAVYPGAPDAAGERTPSEAGQRGVSTNGGHGGWSGGPGIHDAHGELRGLAGARVPARPARARRG